MSGERGELNPIGHATAGAISSTAAQLVVYPLEMIKTRHQAQAGDTTFRALLLQCLREEGVAGLFRGAKASVIKIVVRDFTTFLFYELLRPYYTKPTRQWRVAAQLLLGIHAAALSSALTMPATTVCVRIQASRSRQSSRGFATTLAQIVQEEGPWALWSGFWATLILSVNPAISFLVYEALRDAVGTFLRARNRSMNAMHHFVLGAVAKCIASTATYPYILGKIRQQSGLCTASGKQQDRSILRLFSEVVKTEGLSGLYRGLLPHISKAVLIQALTFMLKEEVSKATLRAVVLLRRSNRSLSVKAAVSLVACYLSLVLMT